MKSDKKCLEEKTQVLHGNEKPTTGHEQIKSHRLSSNMASPKFLTISYPRVRNGHPCTMNHHHATLQLKQGG